MHIFWYLQLNNAPMLRRHPPSPNNPRQRHIDATKTRHGDQCTEGCRCSTWLTHEELRLRREGDRKSYGDREVVVVVVVVAGGGGGGD